MTTDLRTALELLVGDGPSGYEDDELPWDLEELARSIRRARRVRSGIRGAVSVGAAASFGLAGTVVAGSWGVGGNRPNLVPGHGMDERSVAEGSAPSARRVDPDPDAAPGACQSSILDVPRADLLGDAQLLTVSQAGSVSLASSETEDVTILDSPTPVAVWSAAGDNGSGGDPTLRMALTDSQGTVVALAPLSPVRDKDWTTASASTQQTLSTAMLAARSCVPTGKAPAQLLPAGRYSLVILATDADGQTVRADKGREWQVSVDPTLPTVSLTASRLRDSDGDGRVDRADPVVSPDSQVYLTVGDTASTLLSSSGNDDLLLRVANGLTDDGAFDNGWEAMLAQYNGWVVAPDPSGSGLTIAVKAFAPLPTSGGGARRQVLVSIVTDPASLEPLHLTSNDSLARLIVSLAQSGLTLGGTPDDHTSLSYDIAPQGDGSELTTHITIESTTGTTVIPQEADPAAAQLIVQARDAQQQAATAAQAQRLETQVIPTDE